MNESNRTSSSAGVRAGLFIHTAIAAISLLFISPAGADVIDDSLKVRLNFDAAPVGDLLADTSLGGGHPGTNLGATWVASEAGRQGVMSFDGAAQNQITLAAAPDLNSTRGTIAFWMKSANVTQEPNPYAILWDRRTAGGDVIFQDSNGHLANQAQQASGESANTQTTVASSPTREPPA